MDTLEEVPAIEDVESEVGERLEVFVRAYVSEFEEKLEEYDEEAAVGGIGKTGKIADKVVAPAVGVFDGPAKVIATGSKYFSGKDHRKRGKKITQIFQSVTGDELRKMFVEAGSLIYYSFQTQFESVTDADGNWKRALRKLAIDACNRTISYLLEEETETLSKDLLTKAVILGESKKGFISQVIPSKMRQLFSATKPGHTVKNESKEWKTSDIYEKVGIKIVGSDGQTKYYKKKMCGNDYGYRWAFSWENDSSWMSTYEEDYSYVSEDTRTSLKVEELEVNMVQILTNINKEDTKLQSDRIEDGVDTVKADIVPMKQDISEINTKLSSEQPQSDKPKIFTVREPVKTFTGRERELTLLHDKLQTHQNQVVVSQCASISGLGGMGKSELARKYAHTYQRSYGSCIWIDSETQSSITQSFHGLAEKLKIPIMQKRSDSEKPVQRNILLIVEDIYKCFSNIRTLFIFDNVNEYEEIRDYLPSNLSPTDEKPTIIITSRNSDWDIGDEGDVGLILLDQFTPEEALNFVKKVLEIKDEDTSHDSLISELTEELCCFPLALRQAALYIKAKKFSKSPIENYLVEFRDEKKKRDLLKYKAQCDPYTETTYTTWKITFRNIKKNEANGPLAIRLVEIMAYQQADDIPLKRFMELAENKEKFKEAVDILLKYSIITVKKDQEEYYEESDEESDDESDEQTDEENDEEKVFYAWHVANIHRLAQQVIRLWLQDQKREEDVLRTALTQVHNYVPEHHRAAIWSFACKYTTLIDNYFRKIYEEHRFYNKFRFPLKYLVEDGDVCTIKRIFDYLEGMNDLWNGLSSHILHNRFVECRHNDPDMENTGHQTHIKTLVLFHAEVHKALKHSYTRDLELFLQNFDKSLINSWLENRTALNKSVDRGNLNVVKILIENGADVNHLSRYHGTALHIALSENHPHLAEYLLDHGADSNIIDSNGWTALESACYHGHLNVVKRLVDTRDISIIGTEVNAKPLVLAVQNNQVEIVEFLTNHEVYRSAMKDHGQSLCHVAARRGSIQVVKYLIENKFANVNGRAKRNETLLFAAFKSGRPDILKYLLTDKTHDKVDINAFNVFGYTPLFHAVLLGNVQIVRLFIEHGAVVDNVQNRKTLLGQLSISALHLAVAVDCLEIVRLLIDECNANINMGINTTFSPLQVARYFDNEHVSNSLISKGADTSEWREANLKNITRRFLSFCKENKDIAGVIFNECNSLLCGLQYSCINKFKYSSDVSKRIEKLRSFIKKLELDMSLYHS